MHAILTNGIGIVGYPSKKIKNRVQALAIIIIGLVLIIGMRSFIIDITVTLIDKFILVAYRGSDYILDIIRL